MSLLEQPLTDGMIQVRLEPRDAAAFVARPIRRYVSSRISLGRIHRQAVLEQLRGVITDGLRDGHLAVLAVADAGTDEFLGSITLFDVDLFVPVCRTWTA